MDWWITLGAFIVGTVVGLTGMGGGALMTPALIFLGVGVVVLVPPGLERARPCREDDLPGGDA